MRYIVVEYNERDPATPHIRVYASRQKAIVAAEQSANTCAVYWFGSDLAPVPVEIEPEPAKRDRRK